MLPEDIKQLRKDLSCTAKELADTLKVDQREVWAWERGERFPTKRYVVQMEKLREKGPEALVRKRRGPEKTATGIERLDDPKLWQVVRKLLEHPPLFDRVVKLAEEYEDPAVRDDG